MMEYGMKDIYIGEEVSSLRRMLDVQQPIDTGVIESWDAMEKVWRYIFQQLQVDPSECAGVVLTEAIAVPKANRAKML